MDCAARTYRHDNGIQFFLLIVEAIESLKKVFLNVANNLEIGIRVENLSNLSLWQLKALYGDCSNSHTTLVEWCNKFRLLCESTKNLAHLIRHARVAA